MSTTTKRSIRRNTLSGREKALRATTMQDFIEAAKKAEVSFGIDGHRDNWRGARRVLSTQMPTKYHTVLTFRHPTKKATAGRYAVVRVQRKAAP